MVASGIVHAQNTISATYSSTRTNGSTSGVYNPLQDPDDPENQDTVADNTPQGIVYDTEIIPDSVLRSHVFSFPGTERDVKIRHLQNPSLLPTGLQCNDPLSTIEQYSFINLGAIGQVHQPMFYNQSLKQSCLLASPDPLPYYRQQMHLMRFFQSQTPYTSLGYSNSLDKDYQINIVHTQNIKPRWNIALLYDLVSREGLYTSSGLTDHYLDLTTNYYSKDARYQLQAAMTYNRIRHDENGGVLNDTTCWDYSRESGVPVNMYNAQNQWRDIELHIHQSLNTVRQFDLVHEHTVTDTIYDTIPQIRDTSSTDSLSAPFTIKPRAKTNTVYDTTHAPRPSTFNTGVFALDVHYARHRRIFTDNQATSWFYNYASNQQFINSASHQYFDSTAHRQLSTEVYWTNDAHMQHRYSNPVVLTGGIKHQYDELCFADPDTKINELNLIQFARARLHVGPFLLEGNAEETNGPRRLGDYRLDGTLSIDLGASNFSVSALSEAQSPPLIFYHNVGCYSWNNDDYKKTKQQRLAAEYNYRTPDSSTSIFRLPLLAFKVASTVISDNIWFDSQMQPTQSNATAMLLQADLCAHLQLGWFNLRTRQMLQRSGDNNVVRIPLFASKNSIFADFNMFRGAMRTQIGVDARYHTKYYCDAWNPVLGAFYRQDEVEIGDYLVADLWITLQVKRATIYLRASHLNAPIEQLAGLEPAYFCMPHYPYENFTLYWGIIWRFFD